MTFDSDRCGQAIAACDPLRDPDAFLATDLGVRRALDRLGEDPRPAAVECLGERWRPYRAYAGQHLWGQLPAAPVRNRAADAGRLAA